MKKILLILSISLLATLHTTAQKTATKFPVEGVPIKVLNWGTMASNIIPKFWKINQKEIIAQIGVAETNKMKKFCSINMMVQLPKGLQYLQDTGSFIFPQQAFEKLHIYKIGSFINRYNKAFMIKKAILRIPYTANEGLLKDAVWEGNLYYIIDYDAIKIIK